MVFPPAYASFSLMRELPSYSRLLNRLGEGRTLIRFDMRGVGLSDRELNSAHPDVIVLDPLGVADALGLQKLSILGAGPMGATALNFAARNPDRVQALITFGTMLRVTDRSWHDAMITMFRGSWPAGIRALAGANLRHPPEDAERMVSIYQRSTSGHVAAKYMEDNLELDLAPQLPNITARTLVIHSQDDALYPFSCGQEIAAGIRGARLLPLEGNVSITSLGHRTDTVGEAICHFLDEDPETRAVAATEVPTHEGAGASGLRTVLFTDLVGHSEMMARLGDEKGREVLREHERVTRDVLKHHGGIEVKTMGDGFMASFASVTRAVECAVDLQRSFAAHEGEPLVIRVGLNAGEPIEEDGDLFGATVILAARIAAKADGGEILVADTVRGLCSGKGFLFSDRGEFEAKGFGEPVRIFEVQWQH